MSFDARVQLGRLEDRSNVSRYGNEHLVFPGINENPKTKKEGGPMTLKQFAKAVGTVGGVAVCVLAGALTTSPGLKAADHDRDRDSDESRIQLGFEIAPVPLHLHGKDRDRWD